MKWSQNDTLMSLRTGLNFTMTLEMMGGGPPTYQSWYQPIAFTNTGKYNVKGQLSSFYPNVNAVDRKPMLAAVGVDEETGWSVLMNIH